MEKAKQGRINAVFHGATFYNDEGEATIEVKGVTIRDMSPEKSSALAVRLDKAIIHDAEEQANAGKKDQG